jgi:hypothetical protein
MRLFRSRTPGGEVLQIIKTVTPKIMNSARRRVNIFWSQRNRALAKAELTSNILFEESSTREC